MTVKAHSRRLATAQLNRLHITLY